MPRVSVIVPCYNEQNTIQLLLEALAAQTYPRGDMEVILADGMSTDQTRQRVQEFLAQYSDLQVRIVDNVKRIIPAGLNVAIRTAQGEIIVRLDAHCVPNAEYVARSVQALDEGWGDNVGGVWEIRPGNAGWQARAVAAAAAHPLGVGDARYRYTEIAQQVDTVPFGAFRCQWVEKIGLFDENLLTNEDYEFNVRLRQAGGKVWLDPQIRSVYFARSDFWALARQYWRYGFWKARMLRRYPQTIRWRQALPPLFVLSLLILGLLSCWLSFAGWLFMIELATYVLIMLLAGIRLGIQKQDFGLILGVPLAIATMHVSWGSAFLWSMIFR